jgi:hypothetical protein
VVLDAVQMFDQEVASAWLGAEKRLHVLERPGVDRAAARLRPVPATSAAFL